MKLKIVRIPEAKQTPGYAGIIDDNDIIIFQCKTLELPWLDNQRRISCIPKGSYKTIRHRSPKYGDCFWLQDVPGRSEILIHAGNFAGSKNPKTGTPDTLGCILPGASFADIDGDGFKDVTSSGATMKKLLELLPHQFITEIH